jgi:hypothetical protein
MYYKARLAVLLLTTPFVVAACTSSGQQHTTRLLDQRMQAQLAPDIAAGNAALQFLPDGARVTLLSRSSFPGDVKARRVGDPDIRSSVIEGLLDPSLMRVQVADTAALPDRQRQERIRNVNQYFVAYGLGSTLETAVPEPASSGPAGLTIDIRVKCPPRHDRIGYGSGKSMPVCD